MKPFRLVTASLLLVGLIGCVSGDQQRGTPHYNIVSVEDEWQLGAQLAANIAKRVQLVADPQALTYLQGIGERLVRQSRMANLPWEFHVINSPDFNAFAAPGGHIYVTSGAIRSMGSASELAGLVAHVLGHAVDRQSTAALSNQYGPRDLARIAGGINPTAYQDILNQVLSGGPSMRFSAADETAADDPAAKALQRAGYDPAGLVSMIQNVQATQGSNPGAQRFLAAHPLAAEMITSIQGQISKLPKKTGLITDEPEFHAVQGRL
jgi:beta-barrel assembly-enhancing protease